MEGGTIMWMEQQPASLVRWWADVCMCEVVGGPMCEVVGRPMCEVVGGPMCEVVGGLV